MKNPFLWIVIFLLAALAAWYFSMREDQAEIEQAEVVPAPVEEAPPAPEPRYPVEDIAVPGSVPGETAEPAPAPDPLPTLAESDPEVLEDAAALSPALEALLIPEFVLSRLVATVDALDGRRVAPAMRPTTSVPGRFLVLQSEDQAVISPENAARYRPLVAALESVETDALVALYVRYYPLLQQAYLGQGQGDERFNDRVVEIIDLLLATPEPVGMIEVVQNEAVWEFRDPELEALAVGQKALLRLSPEDRRTVKAKLRDLRDALTGADGALD